MPGLSARVGTQLVFVLALGCTGKHAPAPSRPALANPAAEHCVSHEGTYEIVRDAEGNDVGMCVFADGSRCEAGGFMRGTCARGG